MKIPEIGSAVLELIYVETATKSQVVAVELLCSILRFIESNGTRRKEKPVGCATK